MSIDILRNRITLDQIPFTERGSRLMLFRQEDQFSIRLAERWTKLESEVGHYRHREPIVNAITLLNADGAPVTGISTETYPHVVRVFSPPGRLEWIFLDTETLLLRLPAGRIGLAFTVYADKARIDQRGGVLTGLRSTAYTTNATVITNSIEPTSSNHFHVTLLLDAPHDSAILFNVTPRLAYNRSIPDPDAALRASFDRWQTLFAALPQVRPDLQAQYYYAWWIMYAGLLNTRYYFTREALVPSKVHYVGVWHWDQVFHALAFRRVDARLAEDQLRIVLDHQREDGMLPDAIYDEGTITHLQQPIDADVTKPPIMTWAVLKLYESAGRVDFLHEVYEPLTRWNQWWMERNRDETGLCFYRHPFSSGLDDSPLWDHGMPAAAPDLNTYLVLQNEGLATIARILRRDADAAMFQQRADALLEAMLGQLWDEGHGVFAARTSAGLVPVSTPFHLLPLLTGRLPRQKYERLIAELTTTYWTTYPIPTVSPRDPAFDANQMWRGPVWLNINYFFIEALKRCGRPDLAADLRRRSLALVMRHNDIYEYYNPFTGDHPPKAAPMFGWSAALFIEMALDETVSG